MFLSLFQRRELIQTLYSVKQCYLLLQLPVSEDTENEMKEWVFNCLYWWSEETEVFDLSRMRLFKNFSLQLECCFYFCFQIIWNFRTFAQIISSFCPVWTDMFGLALLFISISCTVCVLLPSVVLRVNQRSFKCSGLLKWGSVEMNSKYLTCPVYLLYSRLWHDNGLP